MQFFCSCSFFVSSGDSSCRVVFLVILFLIVFFAKINFLCSTRGHKYCFPDAINTHNRINKGLTVYTILGETNGA